MFRTDFEKYDIIHIIKHWNKIDIDDICMCGNYLGCNKKDKFLSIDEQLLLHIIILLGIKNIYFNYSDFYKDLNAGPYYSWLEAIHNSIQFIKENKKSASKDYKGFNIYDYLNSRYINDLSILRKIYLNSYLETQEMCLYILFEYYISNSKYDSAKELIEKNNLILFNNINSIIKIAEVLNKKTIDWFLYEFQSDYNLIKHDLYEHIDIIDVNDINNDFRVLSITPILKFLISYYNYLNYYNEYSNSEQLFSILMLFEKGYKIEDFINKVKYEKMIREIIDYKGNNIEDIDDAIDKIHKKIQGKNLVDSYQIENIVNLYPHIKFENLNNKVKQFVATGDAIIKTFDERDGFDYSSAVIEWSKAVELEINEKLIKPISNHKYDIENYANSLGTKKPFTLNVKNATIGTIKAIKDYNIQEYLYKKYFYNIYTFSYKEYNELCEYINLIVNTRNESAHKDNLIDIVTAKECKEKILAANRILEIFSKLEKN